MTIVVTIKVNDGIVLAGDSATSLSDASGAVIKVYNNANKIFNLVKGKPIGAMTYASGSIGNASISTLSKELRIQLGKADGPFYIDKENYTIRDVATKALSFFLEKYRTEYPHGNLGFLNGYRVCGYSTGGLLPEVWEIIIGDNPSAEPVEVYRRDAFGPAWAGDIDAISRLVRGVSVNAEAALVSLGVDQANAGTIVNDLAIKLEEPLSTPAMPIQDAIELARFLAETAARFAHFKFNAPTVGGPIEVATITKYEGFKWVSRKHFYHSDLNSGGDDHVH